MFDNIEDAIQYVTSKRSNNIGLDRFESILKTLGNPQDCFNSIHIGGTNGKGSTTNFLKDILVSGGYKVGTFTSPHLVSHLDRIRINDKLIDEEVFMEYLDEYHELIESEQLNMFEIDMLIASMYFKKENVDYAIFEVGIGGRLDATNVLHHPLVCAICTIGLDHTELLGNTLEQIAKEKAGIIKENVPMCLGNINDSCVDVIKEVATSKHAEIIMTKPYIATDEGIRVDNINYPIGMFANYQKENAALAITIISTLIAHNQVHLKTEDIQKGIYISKWDGRFEEISNHPLIILDGAHNNEGMKAMVKSLDTLPHPVVGVFAALKDKPTSSMVDILYSHVDNLIVTQFDFYRAEKCTNLKIYDDIFAIANFEDAIKKAKELSGNDGTIIICGSLYFISYVKSYFTEK